MSVVASKRVCVVGGTGTISRSIVSELVAAGHDVSIFVRGSGGRKLPQGVRVIRGDRRDRAAFEATMQGEEFDVAYDMICYGPGDAHSDLRAFEAVEHLIHTSTVCTFGGPFVQLPVAEETPVLPVMDYGKQKLLADEVFLDAYRQNGFPVTIIKPAHTWGPGLRAVRQIADGTHSPHWIDRLRAGKQILITDGGRHFWSMCHSEDAANAYLGLMAQPWAIGETYILAGDQPTTWISYHEQVADALDLRAQFVSAPVDAVIEAWPEATWLLKGMSRWDQWYDNSKLRAAVPEFQPQLTVRDRIAELVRWMEQEAPPAVPSDREDDVLRILAPLLSEPIEAGDGLNSR